VVDIPNAHQSRILHIAMSPDGQTVCTGAADENLKFWPVFSYDPKSMKLKHTGGGGRADEHVRAKNSPDFG
jgi:cell division cycle protein 20 (cofactor of APC complex)